MYRLCNRLARPLLAIALFASLAPATASAAPALAGVTARGREVVSVERLEDVPSAEETADVAAVDLDDVAVDFDAEGHPRLLTKTVEASGGGDRVSALSTFPRSFDLRHADLDGDGAPENYVSSVKNQGVLGTCWAFAATSAAETSIMSESKTPVTDDYELDLSEHHLAWFTFKALDDAEAYGDQNGEGLYSNVEDPTSSDVFTEGG